LLRSGWACRSPGTPIRSTDRGFASVAVFDGISPAYRSDGIVRDRILRVALGSTPACRDESDREERAAAPVGYE
jgi:hypothetical protein